MSYFDKICNEVKILCLLNENKNIAQLYEVLYSPTQEYIYLVCEYCDLGTIMNKHPVTFNYYHNFKLIQFLSQFINEEVDLETEDTNLDYLIKKNSLSFEIKKKFSQILFPQIFEGISSIHKNKIVHRDIKPDNVVYCSKSQQCKIIDFSHSLIINDKLYMHEPAGSVHFEAPELFELDKEYDPFKADIWSIGVFLYIFLAEELPFDSESEIELQMMILQNEVKFPSEFDTQTKNILSKLLEKDPNKRLTDANLILLDEFFTLKK